MEQIALSAFHYAYSWASYFATYAVGTSDAFTHSLASYAILSPIVFAIFYFVFMLPMIIGDGLTRNIPFLGVMFYRVMAFGIILLASQLVGFSLGSFLAEQGWLSGTLTDSQIKYGLTIILACAFSFNSYKKLENLLSATFYWKRTYGVLDGIALSLALWIFVQ